MSEPQTHEFLASDSHRVYCYRWWPDVPPRAIIHIAHGMGEHAGRYEWVAEQLVKAGFAVTANDHRGHGRTATVLMHFGPDGWNRIIKDLFEINREHAASHPDLPRILLGHSMGAMLAQQYIALHGETLDAAILSGSPGFGHPVASWISRMIARFEAWRLPPLTPSSVLQALIFGSANKNFEAESSEPTGFEWLSRDRDQVRVYVDDPLCGGVPFPAGLVDLGRGAHWTQKKANIGRIPANLPLYLFSGTDDPVHGERKNLERLMHRYADAGLSLQTRFYEGGRHEMLNETNRDQVIQELLTWLDRQLLAAAKGAGGNQAAGAEPPSEIS